MQQFEYYKWIIVSNTEYKINYKNKREKYTHTIKMGIKDEKKSSSALEANNMHYLDALLVQHISKQIDVICIHDCFGVRLSELHVLMDITNKYYNTYTGIDSYGLHILL
jgi:hypothetical protein